MLALVVACAPLLVALVVLRRTTAAEDRRVVFAVAGLAFAVRMVAVGVLNWLGRDSYPQGLWLNDEASFYRATDALIQQPLLNAALPLGLDHLGGDAYLGVATLVSLLLGEVQPLALRVLNAGIGTLVVVLGMIMGGRLFGPRASLAVGIVLAVWPTLVLWSATMLRDTLGAFAVMTAWWALSNIREIGGLKAALGLALSLALMIGLRPYLGGISAAGILIWLSWPALRRASRPVHALLVAACVAGFALVMLAMPRSIDFALHELLYRQTVTRMETLGRLYTNYSPEVTNQPFRPGDPVGVVEPGGWVQTGVVQDFDGPRLVRVAFTDETIRLVPVEEVTPLMGVPITPLQPLRAAATNLLSVLTGTSTTSDASSPAWVLEALAWDCLLVAALIAALRTRLDPRHWLFPATVVGGTLLALVTIPGAPGNADRHRTTQTLPFLVVVAGGLVTSRAGAGVRLPTLSSMTKRPSSDPAPAISRRRSAR